MINFFDRIYSLEENVFILRKLKFYSLVRFLIRITSNVILPLYFRLTSSNVYYSIEKIDKNYPRIIVSLTSFPARIHRVSMVVESILRQDMKPDMIVLWLSKNQFNDLNNVSYSLKKLQKRGLSIRFVDDDLRSHKKYFYAFQEFPDDYVLTIDDDIIYNSKVVSSLIELSHEYPDSICCNVAQKISYKDGEIMNYINWKNIKEKSEPSYNILAIGAGGILYPPNSLSPELFEVEIFKKLCFNADDIWLNFMAKLFRTKVVKSDLNSLYLPVINFNNTTLHSVNVMNGLNDLQLNLVRLYYIEKCGIDLFSESF
jgi:hypothetical protein